MHKELHEDFCAYASSRFPEGYPDGGEDNHDAITNVFPSLISVLLYTPPIETEDSGTRASTCQLHLYGEISPSALVSACRWTRGDTASASASEDLQVNDASSEGTGELDRNITIDMLILHQHARLLMAKDADVHYASQSVKFGCGGPGSGLDLRLLRHTDNTQETLDGCVWLINKGVTSCDPEVDTDASMSRGINVLCHPEMVRLMAETVSQEQPRSHIFAISLTSVPLRKVPKTKTSTLALVDT